MLAELEAYLNSAELFWPLAIRPDPSHPHVPRLTIGGLLLILDEITVDEAGLSGDTRHRYSRTQALWETLRLQHTVALERKASREIEARLRLWQNYLMDLSEQPEVASDYPAEVHNRLMIARLMDTFDPRGWPAQVQERLNAADQLLQSSFRKGAFVLAAALKPAYPPFEFWFLYGAPAPGPLAA